MARIRTLAAPLFLSAAVLTGCAHKPKPTPLSTAPTADQYESIKTSYKSVFPDARVGVVGAVLDTEPYALVNDIDTANLQNGAIISFLDAEQTVVANGTVVKVDPGSLTVKFDAGKRKPVVGDAAVKF